MTPAMDRFLGRHVGPDMNPRLLCASAVALVAAPALAQPRIELATDRVEALMLASDGSQLPVHEERLTIQIAGEYATTTMRQTYFNASSSRIEGNYSLRPGSGSHVDGFAYWNGEQKIVGEVFEKQLAHQVYDSVTARRRDPGLLEADGEGAFAFKVFPIEPKENKRVEVRWNKWLERHANAVHYRAPITSRAAEIVIEINGNIKNVRSSTHELSVEKLATGVRLRSKGAVAPGELDLDWDLDEPAWTPDVYVQQGNGKEEGWFALALAAPTLPETTVTAKDMTIVIDRSGSMTTDDKMEHAKRAAIAMVHLLGPNDRVNVISFSDEVDPLFKTPQAMTAENRQAALDFISRLHPIGGTDIALALKTAVADQVAGSENPEVVVFLTDGQSDAAQASAVTTGNVRLFTLGLGRDVNKPLLSRLAAEKRGRFVFIENADAIEKEVGRLAKNIAKPLLVDVAVTIDGANAVRIYPRTLPDLFAEDELRISGRLRGTGTVKFTVTGKLAGKPVSYTRSIDLGKATPQPWAASLWAQARIDHLLEEIALDGSKTEDKDEVLELSLAYNVITPYTAFLAVPESELGGMHDTVLAARARKAKIMAANEVAMAPASTSGKSSPFIATNLDVKLHTGSTANDEASGGSRPAPEVEQSEQTVSHAHGCAGCAMTGSSGGTTALVIFGTMLTLLRPGRRRSSRKFQ